MRHKKDGPAVTTDRTVSYSIGAARFAVVVQTFAAGKVLATSCRRAVGETFEREARDYPIRVAVHALTCIHLRSHAFGDFTFTQLRSLLLISLQLRLQFESRERGVETLSASASVRGCCQRR